MNHTSTTRSGPRRAVSGVIAALLALAVTGCLKVDMDLSIDAEAVDGSIVTAIDRQTARLFGMQPEDFFEDTGEADFGSLDGVTTEAYEDDDWIGTAFVFNRVALDDLNELAGADEEMPRILHDAEAGTYEFLMTLDFSDFLDDGDLDDDAGFPGLDPSVLLEDFEVRVAVTFPGEVTEHNGDLSGTTVTWHPEPGEVLKMRAVAQAAGADGGDPAAGPGGGLGLGGGDSSTSAWIAILVAVGVLLLVAIGALVLWLALRKPATAAGATAATPEAAPAEATVAGGDPVPAAAGGETPASDAATTRGEPPAGAGQPNP